MLGMVVDMNSGNLYHSPNKVEEKQLSTYNRVPSQTVFQNEGQNEDILD